MATSKTTGLMIAAAALLLVLHGGPAAPRAQGLPVDVAVTGYLHEIFAQGATQPLYGRMYRAADAECDTDWPGTIDYVAINPHTLHFPDRGNEGRACFLVIDQELIEQLPDGDGYYNTLTMYSTLGPIGERSVPSNSFGRWRSETERPQWPRKPIAFLMAR